jgi:hypothetical protein
MTACTDAPPITQLPLSDARTPREVPEAPTESSLADMCSELRQILPLHIVSRFLLLSA